MFSYYRMCSLCRCCCTMLNTAATHRGRRRMRQLPRYALYVRLICTSSVSRTSAFFECLYVGLTCMRFWYRSQPCLTCYPLYWYNSQPCLTCYPLYWYNSQPCLPYMSTPYIGIPRSHALHVYALYIYAWYALAGYTRAHADAWGFHWAGRLPSAC